MSPHKTSELGGNHSFYSEMNEPLPIPGRVRIEIPELYRNSPLARLFESELSQEEGILRTSANPLTGRLLVQFSPKKHRLKDILKRIQHVLTDYSKGKRAPLKTRKLSLVPPLKNDESDWHTLPIEEVARRLNTLSERGLNTDTALARLKQYGPNRLSQPLSRSDWALFLEQFQTLPVGLLVGSAAVSVLTGGLADAALIMTVVLLNNYIGYRTESSAQKTISSLLKNARAPARVFREGKEILIDPDQVVPGDKIALVPGTLIQADARLIHVERLSVDESILTGESLPVEKIATALKQKKGFLADRTNMVFKGCLVTSGSGTAIAVATGMQSEIGKVQKLMMTSEPPETQMQKQLSRLGNQAAGFALAVSGALLIVGITQRQRFLKMLKTSISLAVAAIPESLPTIATTTIARGVQDLKKEDILIRQLDAIETLATINMVCFDKTGTLTLNQLEVTQIITLEGIFDLNHVKFLHKGKKILPRRYPSLNQLMKVAILCNEAEFDNKDQIQDTSSPMNGSSTETALLKMAVSSGIHIESLRKAHPLRSIQYRTEVHPYMLTEHEGLIAVKGAPVEVLQLCKWARLGAKKVRLTESVRQTILSENERMAAQGLRVLGFAKGRKKKDYTWLGLVGMADRIRDGISELVSDFHEAGIDTSMITGDQKTTAMAIGRAIGVDKIYARVSPSQKLRIIRKMQDHGKTVAMIGDGINDGPALKASNVGVAMAAKGAEAAAQAADVVLPSDNLMGIISAIREGRKIHDDVKKSINYIITQNLAEVLFTFLSVSFGQREPLTPAQFLWLNLVTDILPELALAQEPAEADVLKKVPAHFQEHYLARKDLKTFAYESLILTVAPFIAYRYGLRTHRCEERARSLSFLTLTGSSLFYTLHKRSDHLTLFDTEKLPPNRSIPFAIGAGFATELAALFVPALRRMLGLQTTTFKDLLLTTVGSLTPFLTMEASSFVFRPRTSLNKEEIH